MRVRSRTGMSTRSRLHRTGTWRRAYVLADHMFQTQGSGSYTAHQDLIRGNTAIDANDSIIDFPSQQPWGCDSPKGTTTTLLTTSQKLLPNAGPFPCLDVPHAARSARRQRRLVEILLAASRRLDGRRLECVRLHQGSALRAAVEDERDVDEQRDLQTHIGGYAAGGFVDRSDVAQLRSPRPPLRSRPVLGGKRRERDRRKPILEDVRDRHRVGRLGRLLR